MKHVAKREFAIKAGHGGYNDEFRKMLIERTRGRGKAKRVRSATMLEGFKAHRGKRNWDFNHVEPGEHEASHFVYVLSLIHMGHKPDPYDYQGSYQAEAVVLTIQEMMMTAARGGVYRHSEGEILTKRDFVEKSIARFEAHKSQELYERTIAYAILDRAKRKVGVDYHSLRHAARYNITGLTDIAKRRHVNRGYAYAMNGNSVRDMLLEFGKTYGVRVPAVTKSYRDFWYVDAGAGQMPYTSGLNVNGRWIIKPNIPEDRDGFKKLVAPTEDMLGQVYDRILPALELVMNRAAKAIKRGYRPGWETRSANPVFESILMSELNEVIARAPKRDLVQLEHKLRMRGWQGAKPMPFW